MVHLGGLQKLPPLRGNFHSYLSGRPAYDLMIPPKCITIRQDANGPYLHEEKYSNRTESEPMIKYIDFPDLTEEENAMVNAELNKIMQEELTDAEPGTVFTIGLA